MAKAFVVFRNGKPLPMRCHDSHTSGKPTPAEQAAWREAATIVEKHETESVATAALEARFGVVHRGTVTKDMDLALEKRAPDGDKDWMRNKDYVEHERRRGHPVFKKFPNMARTVKDG